MAQAPSSILTEEQLRTVLLESNTHASMARALAVSVNTVRRARMGETYKTLLTDIPRWDTNPIPKQTQIQQRRKISEEAIREILLSEDTNAETARKYDVSPNTVSMIRLGMSHVDVAPELPRLNSKEANKKCSKCCHYGGSKELNKGNGHKATIHYCTLQIPEIKTKKEHYAKFCSYYFDPQNPEKLD